MNKQFSGVCLALFALCMTAGAVLAQDAIINEWSQGDRGDREWVELLVATDGADLRGFTLNDGTQTAASGLTFNPSSAGLWNSMPAGTLIVVYNADDRDPILPPDDISFVDGNFLIVAPHTNTTLFSNNNWNQIDDTYLADGPRLRDNTDTIIHDWDQNDDFDFMLNYPYPAEATAYTGDTVVGAGLPESWNLIPALQGYPSPGRGNGAANSCWIADLRGLASALETSTGFLDFSRVLVDGSRELSFFVTGCNVDTTITVSVPSFSGFEIKGPDNMEWTNTSDLPTTGGRLLVRFAPDMVGDYSTSVNVADSAGLSATVALSGEAVASLPGLNANDVIVNEILFNDDGAFVYPSLGHAITGDWAELLVVDGYADLTDWLLTDKNFYQSALEGLVQIGYHPALTQVPQGTVVVLIFETSVTNDAIPEDLDASDGNLLLKAGSLLTETGDFDLTPGGDNLVLVSTIGGPAQAVDFVYEASSTADPGDWGSIFSHAFSGLSSRTGVWFSRDVNYGYNNDDGSNTYGALGYGWEVGVTRNAMSPGQINAGQAVPHLAARPDPLDFGVISPDFFKTVTLTVENEGIGSLVVNPSTAFVLGPDQTYFEVVPAQPILTLGPDESGEILVRFSPSGILGLIDDAYLNILSNDPRNSGITTVSLVGETQEGVSELIFYDGFRYPDGSLLTAAPSPWVHQSGGNNYRIEGPGSLEYDNFQRPIGRKVRHHNTDGTGAFDEDVRREFEEVSTPPSGQQSVYVSMLVYVESVPDSLGGGYFCHFFDTSGDTFDAPRGLLFVRRHTLDGSQAQFGVRFSPSGSTIFAPNQLPLNQTHLLIMKLTMVAGAADRVDLYVNPALSVAEAAPNATQLSGGGTGSADIARGIGAIGLRQGPFTFNGTLDEIRVGTSWGSVASGVSKPILLLNKQIDVPVGGTVAITSASLLSTDAETPNSDDLLYHIVSLPKYGYLLVDGLELNTYFNDFTQEDINNGLIAYRHEGASIPLDTFIFEVIDPSGESTGGTFRFRILGFTSVREWVLYE